MPIEYGPDPACAHPNPSLKRICFIKNTVSRPNIVIGDYTYYDDPEDSENFEAHVTHHYDFIGDKLIIGKFTAIAKGVEFVMNGANHRMASVTTYPFSLMLHGWEKSIPALDELPLKGDTVIGNDVWIGQNVTVLPGVHIGDGRRRHNRRRFGSSERYSAVYDRGGKSLQGNKKKIRRRADRIFARLEMVGLGRGKDIPQYGDTL